MQPKNCGKSHLKWCNFDKVPNDIAVINDINITKLWFGQSLFIRYQPKVHSTQSLLNVRRTISQSHDRPDLC